MKTVYPTNPNFTGVGRDELIRLLGKQTQYTKEVSKIVMKSRDFLSAYIENSDDVKIMMLAQELAQVFNDLDPELLKGNCHHV